MIQAATEAMTPMANKPRKDTPVRIDEEVLRIARIVAAYREITLAEYISETLRPIVNAHLAAHQRQASARNKNQS